MKKRPWTKARIKCALEERAMTLTGLAELNGINPKTMRAVWSRSVRPAEHALADFLGVPVEQLFPDRYPIKTTRILSNATAEAIASRKTARAS